MILTTIRESIPVENILKAYLDETEEIDVKVEETQEIIPIKNNNDNNNEVLVDQKIDSNNESKSDNKVKSNDTIDIVPDSKENIKLEINNTIEPTIEPTIDTNLSNNNNNNNQDIKFSDIDIAFDTNGSENKVKAPKDIETLEEISKINNQKRKEEEDEDTDETLIIGDSIDLGNDIINDLSIDPKPKEEIILKDIEVL